MGSKDLGSISDFTLPWSFLCSSTDDHGAFYKGCLVTRGSSKTAMAFFGSKTQSVWDEWKCSFWIYLLPTNIYWWFRNPAFKQHGSYVFHRIFKYNVNVKHLLVVIHPYHQTKWGVSEALDTSGPVSIAVYSEHLNFLWPWNVNCLTLRFWFANIIGITDIVG